jgi:hypothetical protein
VQSQFQGEEGRGRSRQRTVRVKQHAQPRLHIRIDHPQVLTLPRRSRLRSRLRRRNEQIDYPGRGVPGGTVGGGWGGREWGKGDGGVGEGDPFLERSEGTEFLTFVDIGDGE